jgi:hypothetical protein
MSKPIDEEPGEEEEDNNNITFGPLGDEDELMKQNVEVANLC